MDDGEIMATLYLVNRSVDTTRNNRSGISITSASRQYTRVPKLCAAQSLPMAVPIFNQRNDKDYDEVFSVCASSTIYAR